ncbi:MAG: methyltransferase domain-containing protein [Sphingobacteriales bacterium]|nr:MAG: methyltransferase domain-containing protein [Sphingobacteriales bacterium]
MNHTVLLLALLACAAFSPRDKNRPFDCGFYVSDSSQVHSVYRKTLQYIETAPGERIASIGAQNGIFEVELSFFRPGIVWTVQDINPRCLNEVEFGKVKRYYEELMSRKLADSFSLVLGTEDSTRLASGAYDRVLLLNTYHELSDKATVLREIHRVLRAGGRLVVMERMASKPGKIRKDCGHLMPLEGDLLADLERAGFRNVNKSVTHDRWPRTFYTFERAD